ncbi:MAG TPA: mechanosensitive ion channel family protein [Chryseosolibacter sp.]|nr:mechanosensitive ion channel family protein [Chryseosolibacter sp.]
MKIWGNYWDHVLFAVVVIAIAVVLGRLFRFLIGRGVKGAMRKLKIVDPTKYNFLKNAVEFIVYMIAAIVIFRSIPTLRTYGTALFAGAGVLAAIVGFASQSAFSNIVSGIFIVIFKPFSVGDRVRVGTTYTGDVEDITLRHTIIKDFENRRIVIPNSVMNNETIVNSTLMEEKVCMFIELGITFESDNGKAMQIMQDEALRHRDCLDNRTAEEKSSDLPQVEVRLINFTDSAQMLRAYVWAKDPTTGFNLKCDLLKSIKERFDREGVELAYPHRTLYLKQTPTPTHT